MVIGRRVLVEAFFTLRCDINFFLFVVILYCFPFENLRSMDKSMDKLLSF